MLKKLLSVLRRKSHAATPSPDLWAEVERTLPCLNRLTPEDRRTLRSMALDFLHDKVFAGAAGFEPDAKVRLSIALQACLPVLRLGLHSYAGWRGIVVYPGDFAIPRQETDEAGLHHEYLEDALGEAWEGGPVVLGWFADMADYAGANVVIHEFAHQIDMLNGDADGNPPLHAGMDRAAWNTAMAAAFDDLGKHIDAGEETALDPYAAEHPGEFFAVCAEVFFTQPEVLYASYPEVFQQLELFFRQNPLALPPPP